MVNLNELAPEWVAKHFRAIMNRVKEIRKTQLEGASVSTRTTVRCSGRCKEFYPIASMNYRFSVIDPITGETTSHWYCDNCYKMIRR